MGKAAAKPAKCKPITVSFEILTEDELRKIIFGLTKGCNPDNTSFWKIHFQLQQRATPAGVFVDRVKLDVAVDDENNKAAEKTSKGLNDPQTDHLLGPGMAAADLRHSGDIDDEELGGVVQETVELA
jgi:hypothetical protein